MRPSSLCLPKEARAGAAAVNCDQFITIIGPPFLITNRHQEYRGGRGIYLRRACTSCSVAARHTFKSPLKALPETRVLPSGEKARDQTGAASRRKTASSWPVATSHNLTPKSSP